VVRYKLPAKTVADISLRSYRALAEFRHQIRLFLHFSEEAVRQAGIEPQQHQLLLAIKGIPVGTQPTIGRIAERLQIRHHTASPSMAPSPAKRIRTTRARCACV
jgi:O6-methylguanine-DNA--protein-cysteine methyltransferase